MTKESLFEHYLSNTPYTVGTDADVDRYLRAFSAMVEDLMDRESYQDDMRPLLEAMRGTVRYIADDAFRSGFEACHSNVVVPLRESTVPHETAIAALATYGRRVRDVISDSFEEEAGVPNSLTVAIDEVALPTPTARCLQ